MEQQDIFGQLTRHLGVSLTAEGMRITLGLLAAQVERVTPQRLSVREQVLLLRSGPTQRGQPVCGRSASIVTVVRRIFF